MDKVKVAKEIEKLQSSLSAIRQIAGWTTADLGERIGVTKQTISNIENNKTTMTLTQYIAIRAVIDHEIQNNPDNELLGQVVDVLLNKRDALSKKEKDQLKIFTASAKGGLSKSLLLALGTSILGLPITATAGAIAVTASLPWLSKVFGETDEEKDK